LKQQDQLALGKPAQCAALSPGGSQLAVGGEDGHLRLLTVDGVADLPLLVTATRSDRRTASRLQKLFGRSTTTAVFACVCPVCRSGVEHTGSLPGDPVPCPGCQRPLRFNRKTLSAPDQILA
jgi:hypothetical protein